METHNTTTFYTPNHPQPPSSTINHHHHHQQQQQEPQLQDFINPNNITTTTQLAKEHMFEKPLTPSDVGKLNRLVIPKQHAEKYFPLADQHKGLVLTFEDESGKLWRFRYSYWNSSQSYVLTKGWSRYVKEKRLDAGDVVLFQRHILDCDRMFIGWRRRFAAVLPVQDRVMAVATAATVAVAQPTGMHENVDTYRRGMVTTRRLRLFGVNLECQDNSEPSDSYGSSQSSQSDHQYNFGSNNLHYNMMRYHQHEG